MLRISEGTTVKYEGDYARGLKNGIGKIAFPNGDRYHGMWEDGAIHGEGTYFYRNGDIYSGNWEHGKRAGKAHLCLARTAAN